MSLVAPGGQKGQLRQRSSLFKC